MTTLSTRAGPQPSRPPVNFDRRPMLVFWETTRARVLACCHCRASATTGAQPVAASGVKAVSISLDGAGPATYDGVRGIGGHFDATIAVLRDLVASGVTVQVNTTVMRANVTELADVAGLVAGTGSQIWEVFFLVHVGRGGGGRRDLRRRARERVPLPLRRVRVRIRGADRGGAVLPPRRRGTPGGLLSARQRALRRPGQPPGSRPWPAHQAAERAHLPDPRRQGNTVRRATMARSTRPGSCRSASAISAPGR